MCSYSWGDEEKNTNCSLLYLRFLSHSSYITKPGHARHQRHFFPWWKLVEEVYNFGGLAVTRQVWSRPRPKLYAKALIFLPDVEPQRKAQHQIKVKGEVVVVVVVEVGSHRSISDLKRLQGSGEHLIISDAKQLKTLHLFTCNSNMEDDLLKLLNTVGDDTVLGGHMFVELYLHVVQMYYLQKPLEVVFFWWCYNI